MRQRDVLVLCVLVLLPLSELRAQDEVPFTEYAVAQAVFINKCANCHGDFEKPPNKRFLVRTAFFFDFSGGGKNIRVPPRMAGVRLQPEEVMILRSWVLSGAPDKDNKATISPELAQQIANTP